MINEGPVLPGLNEVSIYKLYMTFLPYDDIKQNNDKIIGQEA